MAGRTSKERLPRFARLFVIARNEAISVVNLPVIARDEAISREFCHREERSDLAFSELANSEKRDCRAALAMTDKRCHREERSDLAFPQPANR
jgi:hypothetical protein